MSTENLELVNQNLEEWIRKNKYKGCYPFYGATDYPECYRLMAEYMNKHVHPEVTKGAIIHQIKATKSLPFNDVIYLNDHGPDHVRMVISKESELLTEAKAKLTPYEAYILLVATHFHDVGIWLGRDEHEKKINKIMQTKEVKKHLPSDDLVLSVIRRIAQAHGGHIDGDKDTINRVKKKIDLNNKGIRKQFLAAILRFSDELADDNTRAKRFVIDGGTDIPEHSKIFHEYSNSLHTVKFDGKDVNLKFQIPQEKTKTKFSKQENDKNGERVVVEKFLLDEIYDRTIKMHREKMYCIRFLMAGGIFIEKIRITIEIYDDDYDKCIETIPYELKETGYPQQESDIFGLCPELEGKNGQWLADKLRTDASVIDSPK